MRFVCALVVCVYHVATEPVYGFIDLNSLHSYERPLVFAGRGSVAVFFVLSGFVIDYSSRKEGSLRRYLAKRTLRIYPLFVLAILSALLLSRFVPIGALQALSESPSSLVPRVGINLLMLQQPYFMPADEWRQPILGLMWSLSYEFWFYLAFGALVVWQRRHVRGWHVILAASVSALLMYLKPWVGWTYPVYFCLWWAGVELSRRFAEEGGLRFGRMAPYLAGIALVALECLWLDKAARGHPYQPWTQFVGIHFTAAALAIGAACASGGRLLLWIPPKPRWVARLGAASYAIYLFHPLVAYVVVDLARSAGLDASHLRWALLGAVLILTTALSVALEEGFHRPVARWLGRGLGARKPV